MRKFLIVDDHALVREGLRCTLQDFFSGCVCDEAGDAQETLNKIWKKTYDLVLLDISLPGRSGLDVLKRIKTIKPDLPVLILSMYEEELFGLRALRAGAAGYIMKKNTASELKTAIGQILQGRKFITPTLGDLLIMEFNMAGKKPLHETLSDDELQVLRMISSGIKPKDIARELLLSTKTVHAMRGRILKKMNMKNNSELTYYAIKMNLIL